MIDQALCVSDPDNPKIRGLNMVDVVERASARVCTKPTIDDHAALLAMARLNAALMSIGGGPNDRLASREAVARMRLAAGGKTPADSVAERLRKKYRAQRAELMAMVISDAQSNVGGVETRSMLRGNNRLTTCA